MVLLRAKGNTKVQMAQAMSVNTEEDIHKGFKMILNQVNNPGSKYLLTTANRLFVEKTYDFLSTFKESYLQFYHSELEQLSFAEATEKSREHINTCISKETKVNLIDEQVRLILVNAIYFQGMWDKPVHMMWPEANFNFIYNIEAQTKVVELPYAGKMMSMIILLPHEDMDLSVVENNLTFEKFIAWTKAASLQNIELEVLLLRFKLQGDYDMESVLHHLGMVDAFQQGQADFSAMPTETDLCLSKVLHKSVVVNEEGTEAAAAIDIDTIFDCISCAPTFHADHRFLFFIRHNRTNTLLFCGSSHLPKGCTSPPWRIPSFHVSQFPL
uniref:Serpin domain-containing protein n=1 Tax=Urocitellus parryii TaxID=9999 RepID=A0A8D2GZC0_UROPR